MIRELRRKDAEAVAQLALTVNPHRIETAELIWQRASTAPQEAHRRDWVAEADGEIVGHAHARFPSAPDTGHFWIGVCPERRGSGIGSQLYATVEAHLRPAGAQRLRTWVDGDPAGERFVRRRGFELRSVDRVSEVDPQDDRAGSAGARFEPPPGAAGRDARPGRGALRGVQSR